MTQFFLRLAWSFLTWTVELTETVAYKAERFYSWYESETNDLLFWLEDRIILRHATEKDFRGR